jgi:hypothetical protein
LDAISSCFFNLTAPLFVYPEHNIEQPFRRQFLQTFGSSDRISFLPNLAQPWSSCPIGKQQAISKHCFLYSAAVSALRADTAAHI